MSKNTRRAPLLYEEEDLFEIDPDELSDEDYPEVGEYFLEKNILRHGPDLICDSCGFDQFHLHLPPSVIDFRTFRDGSLEVDYSTLQLKRGSHEEVTIECQNCGTQQSISYLEAGLEVSEDFDSAI
jgi:acetoin utilization deacetylase AcuC-like enzyme